MTRPLPPSLVDRLRARLNERFTTAKAACAQHGGGGTHLPALPPQARINAAYMTKYSGLKSVRHPAGIA